MDSDDQQLEEGKRIVIEYAAALLPEGVRLEWELLSQSPRMHVLVATVGERSGGAVLMHPGTLAEIPAIFANPDKHVGRLRFVKAKIEQGVEGCFAYEPADLDKRLEHAVKHGKNQTVRASLTAGANPNTRDEDGDAVLATAAFHRKHDIARMLLAAGADVNHRGSRGGWTALGFAAIEGDAEMVELLLDGGADVNIGGPVQTPSRLPTSGTATNAEQY